MSAMKILARVLADEVPGGFRLSLETDDGGIVRLFATENQMADLAEEIDDMLSTDDASDLAEETTEEQPS